MKGITLGIVMLAIMLINLLWSVNSLGQKLDKLIELNTPEAIQLIVPDKPLLEDK